MNFDVIQEQLADFSTFASAAKDIFDALVALFGDSAEDKGAFDALSSFSSDADVDPVDPVDPVETEGSAEGSSEDTAGE